MSVSRVRLALMANASKFEAMSREARIRMWVWCLSRNTRLVMDRHRIWIGR